MSDFKNHRMDQEKQRKSFLLIGFIAATCICLSAFEFASGDKRELAITGKKLEKLPDELVIDYEKLQEKKKEAVEAKEEKVEKKDQAPQNVKDPLEIKKVSDDSKVNENITLGNDEVKDKIVIGSNSGYTDEPVDLNEEFTIVEEMPCFAECASIKDPAERKACTEKMMYQLFGKQLKYPPLPRENGIQGTVMVSFRVSSSGKVDDVKIARGVHDHLDREAMRVVASLPDFLPGKQRGKKVNVRYVVPIKFTLR